MAQAAFTRDVDQKIDQSGAESAPAILRIEHPLDSSDQPQRTAESMQSGVGDDVMTDQREQRKDFAVIDVPSPRLDQRAIVDEIPRESLVVIRQAVKEVVERIDVTRRKGPNKNSSSVTQNGFLRVAMRH